MTKKALLPEVYFLNGPKGSGKTTVGKLLSEKTNMEQLNFDQFCKNLNIKDKDDETKVFKLIGYLLDTINPRVLLEDFPQNPRFAILNLKKSDKYGSLGLRIF